MSVTARLRALFHPRGGTMPKPPLLTPGEVRATLSPDFVPCDRCGNDTGKPWLLRMPRTRWICDPCDRKITEQVFDILERMNEEQDKLLRLRADMPPFGVSPVRPDEEQRP